MAEVAVHSVWWFECPHCGYTARHWKRDASRLHAEDHLYVQHHDDSVYEPSRRTWAFRILHDDQGREVHAMSGGTATD